MFDPKIDPTKIKPVCRRDTAHRPRQFPHGGFSRAVMDILREASAPMTARDIATKLIASHDLRSDHVFAKTALRRVRGMLTRQQAGTMERTEGPGGRVFWRVV
jgi:hypothetical protein